MAQLMSILSFNQPAAADTLAHRLRDAGFHAEVRDESGEQKWQLFNLHPRGQFRVIVPEEEADRAQAQLRAWDGTDDVLATALRCPDCSSTRIEFPQFSRRTIVGALPAALAAAGVIEQDYYCEACQYTWPAEEPEKPDLDPLNWSRSKPVIKGID